MKMLIRLLSFGTLFAGLCFTSLSATTYTLSGSNQSNTGQSWSVSIPAKASAVGSITLEASAPNYCWGMIYIKPKYKDNSVFSLFAEGMGTARNWGGASNIPAGQYNLTHHCMSISSYFQYYNLSTTISW